MMMLTVEHLFSPVLRDAASEERDSRLELADSRLSAFGRINGLVAAAIFTMLFGTCPG
jgi:hypothetical protein